MTAPFPLLPRQQDLLRFIAGYLEAHDGVSPTMSECAAAIGLRSKSGIVRLLDGLEARGAISRWRFHVRAIEVTAPVTLPRSPDGAPLFAVATPGRSSFQPASNKENPDG